MADGETKLLRQAGKWGGLLLVAVGSDCRAVSAADNPASQTLGTWRDCVAIPDIFSHAHRDNWADRWRNVSTSRPMDSSCPPTRPRYTPPPRI